MNIAELCSFCKSSYRFDKEYFTDGKITCSSCGAICEFYFINEERNDPPDLEKDNVLPPDKIKTINEKLDCIKLPSISDIAKCDSPNGSDGEDTKTEIDATNISITHNKSQKSSGSCLNSTFFKGVQKLEEVASAINLEYSITERAKENLKTAYDMKKFQGRSLTALVVSIVFTTSKQCNCPQNFKEMVKVLNLTKEEKNETMRSITSLKDIISASSQCSIATNTQTLVRKYCEELKLETKFTNASLSIAEKICDKGLIEGKLPNTVAAATVFFVSCQMKKFIDDEFLTTLSEVSKTYKNTIASAYQTLRKNYKDILTS